VAQQGQAAAAPAAAATAVGATLTSLTRACTLVMVFEPLDADLGHLLSYRSHCFDLIWPLTAVVAAAVVAVVAAVAVIAIADIFMMLPQHVTAAASAWTMCNCCQPQTPRSQASYLQYAVMCRW
jgi:hypothetical protein